MGLVYPMEWKLIIILKVHFSKVDYLFCSLFFYIFKKIKSQKQKMEEEEEDKDE